MRYTFDLIVVLIGIIRFFFNWYQYWHFFVYSYIYFLCVCMLSIGIIYFDWYSFFIHLVGIS